MAQPIHQIPQTRAGLGGGGQIITPPQSQPAIFTSIVIATQPTAVAPGKTVSVTRSAAQAQSAQAAKSLTRTVTSAQATTATAGGLRQFNRLVTTTVGEIVTVRRTANATRSATEAMAITSKKAVGRSLALTEGAAVTVRKTDFVSRLITQGSAVFVSKAATNFRMVSLAQASGPSVARVVSPSRQVTQATAPSIAKNVGIRRTIAQAQTVTTSGTRVHFATVSFAQPQSALVRRQGFHIASATQTTSVARATNVAARRAATQAEAVAVRKQIATTRNVAQPTATTALGIRVFLHTVGFVQGTSVKTQRQVGRAILITSTPTVAVGRSSARAVSFTQASQPRVSRGISLTRRAAQSTSIIAVGRRAYLQTTIVAQPQTVSVHKQLSRLGASIQPTSPIVGIGPSIGITAPVTYAASAYGTPAHGRIVISTQPTAVVTSGQKRIYGVVEVDVTQPQVILVRSGLSSSVNFTQSTSVRITLRWIAAAPRHLYGWGARSVVMAPLPTPPVSLPVRVVRGHYGAMPDPESEAPPAPPGRVIRGGGRR